MFITQQNGKGCSQWDCMEQKQVSFRQHRFTTLREGMGSLAYSRNTLPSINTSLRHCGMRRDAVNGIGMGTVTFIYVDGYKNGEDGYRSSVNSRDEVKLLSQCKPLSPSP